jgi:two-component system, response regulator YesN
MFASIYNGGFPLLKDISNKIKRYQMRNKIILAYFGTSLLTMLALSLIIYQILSNNVLDRLGENSLLSLKQSARAADMVIREITIMNSQLLVDRDLQNFVYAPVEDKVVTYKAQLVLSRFMSVYPFIQSIELYNDQAGVYFNTMRLSNTELPGYKSAAKAMYGQLEFSSGNVTPKLLSRVRGISPESYRVLSFAFRPSSYNKNNAVFIINLDLAYIQKNILDYTETNENIRTYMVDDNSIIVAQSDTSLFLSDFPYQEDIGSLLVKNAEGYRTILMEGRKYLVAFAGLSELPWFCVSIKPYSELIGGLARIRNIVLLSTLTAFLVALIIYSLMTRSIYGPFQRMLDRLGGVPSSSSDVEILSKIVSRNIRYENSHEMKVRNLFLGELLTGTAGTELEEEERLDLSRQYSAQSYTALLVKFDDFHRKTEAMSKESILLHQFNLLGTVTEFCSTLCRCIGMTMDDDAAALLCCDIDPALLAKPAQEACEAFRNLFHISFSISMGNSVAVPAEVHLSYASAVSRMQYRLFEGHGCILDELAVQPYLNNDAPYPYDLDGRLVFNVQSANQSSIAVSIADLRACLKNAFYENVHYYAAQFIYSLLKFTDSANILSPIPYDAVRTLYDMDTIDDMVEHISNLVKELGYAYQEAHQVKNVVKHQYIIDSIRDYVASNFKDPNLSVETVAANVNLSPEYVRKLFKQIDGNSLSHYITQLRLGKACELLLSTKMSIQSIGEQVGLHNASHFFTLFKKAYGLTPTVFREYHKQSAN